MGNHPHAKEANEIIVALKVEHANQVQELTNKQHVSKKKKIFVEEGGFKVE